MVTDLASLIAEARRFGRLDLLDGKVLVEGRFPKPLIEALRSRKDEVRMALSTPQSASGAILDLPEGWENAVDAWVRAGCPKGDPIMLGQNLAALQRLAQLPRGRRPAALRVWRQQFSERKRLVEGAQ